MCRWVYTRVIQISFFTVNLRVDLEVREGLSPPRTVPFTPATSRRGHICYKLVTFFYSSYYHFGTGGFTESEVTDNTNNVMKRLPRTEHFEQKMETDVLNTKTSKRIISN